MRTIILAGAAALAFTATPAFADHHMDEGFTWSAEQEAMYDAWPADRQAAYDAWPADVQEYYWTLTPVQVKGWWLLTDDQRIRIYEMPPEARAQAWMQVQAQVPNATATAATSAAASASTMTPRFVSKEVTQTTPAGYTAASGDDLPVCKGDQQDGCINSWAKNKTGNRPLEYWPGKPASEIPGKLPAKKPGT